MVEALDLKNQPLEDLVYEREGPVAFVTIDRPSRGNSLTARMHSGMRAIWGDIRDDPAIRVAVLTASGTRHFCTGADVGALAEGGTVSAGWGPLSEELFWTPRQNQVWKPVICAVNGLVAGGGLHFVTDSDIVVACSSAAFMDTHVSVGMVGGVENVAITKRMPLGSALRMTLMGSHYRMPAQRAHELGLVDEVVEDGDLMNAVREMATLIARNSPTAMARSQQAIWGSLERDYEAALEHGWSLVRMHRNHPDSREGPRAFLEKRQPDWLPLRMDEPARRAEDAEGR